MQTDGQLLLAGFMDLTHQKKYMMIYFMCSTREWVPRQQLYREENFFFRTGSCIQSQPVAFLHILRSRFGTVQMFPLVQEVKVRACHFPVISSTLRVKLVVSCREKPSVSFFALFDEGMLTLHSGRSCCFTNWQPLPVVTAKPWRRLPLIGRAVILGGSQLTSQGRKWKGPWFNLAAALHYESSNCTRL